MDRVKQLQVLGVISIVIALVIGVTFLFVRNHSRRDTNADSSTEKPLFEVKSNEEHNEKITVTDEDVVLGSSSHQIGNVSVKNGNVTIEGNVQIEGDITIENGSLMLGNSATIIGVIKVTNGNATLGSNNTCKADIGVITGSFKAGNSNSFMNVIVEGGTLQLGDNNSSEGTMLNTAGKVQIGNSNNFNGGIKAKELSQGENNVIRD